MSDIRQAAERVEKMIKYYEWCVERYDRPVAYLEPKDIPAIRTIYNAYLATHRDDDDEPIDEAFLREMGFEESPVKVRMAFGKISFCRADKIWTYGFTPIPSPQTRGQLRRLLEVLEPSKEGE